MPYHVYALLAAGPAGPTLQPNANGLPGATILQRLADGIGGWALIASMLGIVIGAVLWAFSRRLTRRKAQVSRALSTVRAGGQRRERDDQRFSWRA